MERFNDLITQSDKDRQKSLARQWAREIPFFEQTQSWKDGMNYRYSPDMFPLTKSQLKTMNLAGETIGSVLTEKYPGRVIEFRIDFVESQQQELFVAEAQTDDRGLPAVTQVRNARGKEGLDVFPTIPVLVNKSLEELTKRQDYKMVILYPTDEEFYYSGFYDFRKQIWAENPKCNIIVIPESRLISFASGQLVVKPALAQPFEVQPDLIWDFTEKYSTEFQPRINKDLLLELWQMKKETPKIRKFLPKTILANEDEVRKNKNNFILKSFDERWSKGVTIGRNVSQEEWLIALSKENVLAQRYIDSGRRNFRIRQKNGDFNFEYLYPRVEGYYVFTQNKWQLADVLVTATPTIPVHGMKQCIMVPAKIKED